MGRTLDEIYPFSVYSILKQEAYRISATLYKQRILPGNTECLLSAKIRDEVACIMTADDRVTLLNFFKCKGIRISSVNNKPGLWVIVHTDNADKGTLRHVSGVHPKRVNK